MEDKEASYSIEDIINADNKTLEKIWKTIDSEDFKKNASIDFSMPYDYIEYENEKTKKNLAKYLELRGKLNREGFYVWFFEDVSLSNFFDIYEKLMKIPQFEKVYIDAYFDDEIDDMPEIGEFTDFGLLFKESSRNNALRTAKIIMSDYVCDNNPFSPIYLKDVDIINGHMRLVFECD